MKHHALLAVAAAVVVLTAAANRDGPPPAHTGGFGEPSCVECHYDWDANSGAGQVRIEAPAYFVAGHTYDIIVLLRDPDMAVGGFQLSARFDAGGRNAGHFGTDSPGSRVTVNSRAGYDIEYASHDPGSLDPGEAGKARWVVRWTAPTDGATIVFHVAANAANDDDSPFGDRVYTTSARSEAQK